MDQRIGYRLKQAQNILRTTMDNELRPLDLSTGQYAALSALETTSQASNADLARTCFVTPQSMITVIKGLERRGFIERHAHPTHGRIIQTSLTASGLKTLKAAHKIVNAIEKKMLNGIDNEQQRLLAGLLSHAYGNLAEEE